MTPRAPVERPSEIDHERTNRQAIREALRQGPRTARELATALSLREREVIEDLEHVRRSVRPGERFVVVPAICKRCQSVFEDRARLTRPSRCPRCKSERIGAPKFALE